MAQTELKVLQGFKKDSDPDVIARGHAVAKGLKGNSGFSSPPFDPDVLDAEVDSLARFVAWALDGGKKVVAAKKKQREVVIRMLQKLARYVQENCGNDMVKLTSSGFEAAATTKTPAQLPDQPTVNGVEHGNIGEFLVWIKAVKRARTYDVGVGVMAGGNTAPTNWTIETFASARKAALIKGLTPGATYAIRVRAFGTAGYTGWSDPAIRMAT